MPETPPAILYENSDVIVVDKPEGIPSIPERIVQEKDLLTLLSEQKGFRLFVVHRLDKWVTGAIIYAKNAEAHKHLNLQFSERLVKKTYAALVQGIINKDQGKIEGLIRKFGSGRMGVHSQRGLPSVTTYKVEKKYAFNTLLNVHPLTGRRHQIRVHLYSEGHPIAGDRLYGDQRIQKLYPRLMLHAAEIEFQLPSGKKQRVHCDLPDSFQNVLNELETAQKIGMPQRIVSGGQTGVDRAAMDAALENDLPCSGWCPKGRLAEDGILNLRYTMRETPSDGYEQRTEWNVRDSDGTLVLTKSNPTGGTALTLSFAAKHRKPALVHYLNEPLGPELIYRWIVYNNIRVLNIAGPRESKSPGVYTAVKAFLSKFFKVIAK